MRVALLTGNYNYLREGANQALNRLVHYLEAHGGHEVRVYSPVTDTPAFEPAGTLVPVDSVRLPVRSEFQLALGLPQVIRRDLMRFDPDIIHVATPDIMGTRAQTFAEQRAVPLVTSMHTHFESYLDYYRLGWLKPVLEAHLRRFYRRSDHVLVPTAALVATMRQLRCDDRVSLWSRGVDHELFNPARRDNPWRRSQGIGDDEVVILFFGRLVKEKGLGTFIDIIHRLRGRGQVVRPLIVGDGPARPMLSELAGFVGTGHLKEVELARAVASADIMVTPSVTETFGNVVLEAMASAIPVVSADTTSARSLLVEGTTGYFARPLDVEHYVKLVSSLIASPAARCVMGAAARAASLAYSWDAASQSVESAYRTLVAQRR